MAMKRVDLLIYAVCRSLSLETKVRPILAPEVGEEGYEVHNSSDKDCWGMNVARNVHTMARKRLHDFQDHGFHVPRYRRKHSSATGVSPMDEDLETVLPDYRNMTSDPANHPLAQHQPTLKCRKLYGELRIQQDSYAPSDPGAKLEYLQANIEVEGLVPPDPDKSRVGSKLHEIKIPKRQFENHAV